MSIFNYQAVYKKWDRVSPSQPNVEVSDSIRPAVEFAPADYLSLVRFDKWYEDWFVIQAGKIVALDINNRVVPAGLALQAAAYKTAFENNSITPETVGACRAAARAVVGLTKYTANDVAEGVKNFAGLLVQEGEPVVESFFAVGSTNLIAVPNNTSFGDDDTLVVLNSISKPVGVAPYNYWRWVGGDGTNPTQYRRHNYNLQHQVAILCDYFIELPVVKDTNYAAAPLTGIAAAIYTTGNPFTPGCFVKTDFNSNFVKADPAADSFFDIIGQVLSVDKEWPKDYLERVRTAFDPTAPGMSKLDASPGSATGGLPDNIFLANGSAAEGVVRINLLR